MPVRRRRELLGTNRQLGEPAECSGHPEPDIARPAEEAIAPGEVGGGGAHPGRVELRVEQLGEHAPVPLDELGVDAGHIDLPQVHAGRLPLLDPADGGQQLVPVIREPQRPHGMAGQPGDQAGAASRLDQLGQAAHVGRRPCSSAQVSS